jgi:acetylornithine deacetylase/succinyl-diaminopimelate desuccinylase-like protein
VEVTDIGSGQGWKAPESAPWLEDALQTASHNFFKKEAVHYGMGGSIPLMGLLGKMFPKSYFVITGVLGP